MLATPKLDDKTIRAAILDHLYRKYTQTKNIVIIEELDLCLGEARIDLAVINGISMGIEIKSDKDSLDRIENQISAYNKVFDYIEIVVGNKHLNAVSEKIPSWWGISVVMEDDSKKLVYKKIKKSKKNNIKDTLSVIQLLWKSEALQLLERIQLPTSFKNKSRDIIWCQLIESFPKEELYHYVYHCLKTRQNWRFVHQPK